MKTVRVCPLERGYITTNPKKRKCPRCRVVLKKEKQRSKNYRKGHPSRPKRIVSIRV